MSRSQVDAPSPLEVLLDATTGQLIPLTPALERLYGPLRASRDHGTHVISNFVSTLDGVVALNSSKHESGAEVSGFNAQDQMVMGILRCVADAVVVGAGTLRAVPKALWTAEFIYRPLAEEYQKVRVKLGLDPTPLHVFVTASGEVDTNGRVFREPGINSLIITTRAGEQKLRSENLPQNVSLGIADEKPIQADTILRLINQQRPCRLVLVEGGPRLMSDFIEANAIDQIFLTVAPQIAGRDEKTQRPGFVHGSLFAPDDQRWFSLASVRRGDNHLFLQYAAKK